MTQHSYLVVADIEGISGVVDWSQEDYETAAVREAMAQDVNAAVEGILAIEDDDCEIVVTDSHEHKLSIPSETLHPAASLIRGGPRSWGLVSGVEREPDYALYLGAHAHPGSGGVLEHVFRKTAITEIRVDETPVGEIELNTLVLEDVGTDVVLVTGDDVTCDHVRTILPNALIVETKRALGLRAAECRHPKSVRADIKETTEAALQKSDDGGGMMLSPEYPVSVSVSYNQADSAQIGALWPGVDRPDSKTIRADCDDPTEVYKFVRGASKI
jgi:D-amino peptidase